MHSTIVKSNVFAFPIEFRMNIPTISDRLHTVYVPRLIIQPIVENVFDHAFEDGTMNGVVYIGASYQGDMVRITVEDNGRVINR
jgi:LytS/YehU family sensor histidine kinase